MNLKTHHILIFICLLVSCKTTRLLDADHNALYPICFNNQWGYVNDRQDMVVETKYTKAYLPTHGIGLVQAGDKFGYLRLDGSWLKKPSFEKAHPFALFNLHDKNHKRSTVTPLSLVYESGRPKYMNLEGEFVPTDLVLPSVHGSCQPFRNHHEDIAYKTNEGKYELIYKFIYEDSLSNFQMITDTTSHLRLDTIIRYGDHTYLIRSSNNRYGIVNRGILEGYDTSISPKERTISGDRNYIPIIDFMYDDIKFFRSEFYQHDMPSGIARKGRYWGSIDVFGNTIIPFVYFDVFEKEQNDFYLVEFEPDCYGYISVSNINPVAPGNNFLVVEHFSRRTSFD